ncbi:MAG: agmatine deiminase family protein [Deltaproteobacteria bacterium]|nr:agmatine deiminase family protein [Deltaproteobacteria bacterium]
MLTTVDQCFHMPAEWEPHAATWLAWPHNAETWQGRQKFVPSIWIQMIKALHTDEAVQLLVNDASMKKEVQERLEKADINFRRVRLHEIPTNDCWLRDTGPTFIKKGSEVGLIGWIFNSWGEKWPPWDEDALVSSRIAEKMVPLPFFRPGIVLEGGSIETNGCGTLITTESCLLHPKRNPNLKKGQIEKILKSFLGVDNILWLPAGTPSGDDTDGHIDNLVRFVNPTTIVAPLENDPQAPNYELLRENYATLQEMKSEEGRPLTVIPLPTPSPIESDSGLLPASYANFYIGNGVVLLPSFDSPRDDEAIRLLKNFFPGRRIAKIPSKDLVRGFGGVHCVTQQQIA